MKDITIVSCYGRAGDKGVGRETLIVWRKRITCWFDSGIVEVRYIE